MTWQWVCFENSGQSQATGGMRQERSVSQGPFDLPGISAPSSISTPFLCPDSSRCRKKLPPWLPTQESQNTFFWSVAPMLWSPSAFPFLALTPRLLETSTPSLPRWQFFWPTGWSTLERREGTQTQAGLMKEKQNQKNPVKFYFETLTLNLNAVLAQNK